MAKRSISDQEIGLIKALAIRKMANKDIQFLFNRPDRPVNSGRISNIVAGQYGNAQSIPPSADAQVDAFLKLQSERPLGAAQCPTALDALSEPALRAQFGRDSGGTWRLIAEEGERHECKAGFGFRYPAGWLRAIAALANNRGGFVWFGIHDKTPRKTDGPDQSYAVRGLSDRAFQDADSVEFTKLLKSTFDPTPRIHKRVLTIDGIDVGVLHVEVHPGRPVIATRRLPDDINEGDIFYRYPAQSSRIKYSDLRTLLDERDAHARQQLLPMVERLIAIGPRRSLIADLDRGIIGDGQVSIHIDRDLAQQLQFIKEGEFDERGGAPALRLVGDVSASPEGAALAKAGIITRSDLLRDFLREETPYDSKEYLRFLVESTQSGEWLPLHYFARRAGLDVEATGSLIDAASAPRGRKRWYRERAMGVISAYAKAGGGAVPVLTGLLEGQVPRMDTDDAVFAFANAVRGLATRPPVSLEAMRKGLLHGIDIVSESRRRDTVMTSIRRAACRLDELYFCSPETSGPYAEIGPVQPRL